MTEGATGDQPALGDLFKDLATDARELAHAELALAKARGLDLVDRYRIPAVLFVVAGALGFAALIALLVGLIATLTPIVGAGLATVIVVGVTLLVAGLLAYIGYAMLTRKRA